MVFCVFFLGSLDFPPVNISAVSDQIIKVQFIHPFHIYKYAIIKNERLDHKEFHYMVVTEDHLVRTAGKLWLRNDWGALVEAEIFHMYSWSQKFT